ncbi:MAG: hypothetical protein H6865_01665 [Rhodospirillales bacterium]|nr:hypothetical protein [Alphaproteobacteria bacterium]MCB9986326.1 hypothetical protein [Rhodospirillales bacterium]USO07123.1 MAG: hypothetical protein H6866_06720 [Rhodospirillales bacterium]
MTVYRTADALDGLHARLLAMDPADIVSISDFDLTLAVKPDINFHYVTLSRDQRSVLADASDTLAATIILTARGEASTLSGIFGNAAAFPTCLASNCGHHVLVDTSQPDAKRIRIPLEDEDAERNLPTIMASIRHVLTSVGTRFAHTDNTITLNTSPVDIAINGHGMLTLDPRELSGAIVFERISTEECAELETLFDKTLENLGPAASQFYHVSKKVPLPDGRVNGYIDLKPGGMSKGKTALTLLGLPQFQGKISARTHFLVAGDSAPDLEMMEAVSKRYGQDRVINIWVGDDKAVYDFDRKVPGMTFWNLPGCQVTSITAMYNMLRAAMATHARHPVATAHSIAPAGEHAWPTPVAHMV